MFANSSVIGNSHVGSNVIISAGTRVVNQDVPSNCIVFGESPQLVFKDIDEKQIKMKIDAYWR